MKKIFTYLTFAILASTSTLMSADITKEIPVISVEKEGYKLVPNVAQYGQADWSNVIGMAKGVTKAEAFEIADSHPEISFFFYTKGFRIVLYTKEGDLRIFNHGDAVFFTGEPWWGSAPGLADGYIKQHHKS